MNSTIGRPPIGRTLVAGALAIRVIVAVASGRINAALRHLDDLVADDLSPAYFEMLDDLAPSSSLGTT